jgi:hypothetical protein
VNTRYAKHAPALPLFLPVGKIELRPLARTELERILVEAELEVRSRRAPASSFMLLVRTRVLARSTSSDVSELLYPEELVALYRLWQRWQARCTPDTSKLSTYLRKRVNDDPEIERDAWRAHRAKTAEEFYGCHEVDLTDGQVAYWQLLASAFAEFKAPSTGRRKVPTQQWLKSPD